MIAQLVKVVRSLFRTELEISPLEAQAAEIIAGKPWLVRPSLSQLAQMEKQAFPLLIRESAAAQKYLDLLGPLDWEQFPDRDGGKKRRGPKPAADAPLVAAFLVKMDKGLDSMAKLRQELIEQPALTWVLGFPLVASEQYSWGFDVAASLPTHRHMSRLLRKLPNEQMQFLLKSSVQLFQRELPADLLFGDTISGDTKHIIAWVRENNPKEHIRGGRFHKEKQPKGDADCKVGFKANENQAPHSSKPSDGAAQASAAALPPATESTATPTTEGLPASGNLPKPKDGQYDWGYASGVVACKVADWCEVALAEMTQTFNHSDESYFHPLMAQTEVNLGKKPTFGTWDAAYDTFYTHEYFTLAGGFAAIPWADQPAHKKTFSPDGLPLCEAGLAMPLKGRFQKKSACLVPHEVGRYVCPLLFPEKTGEVCPIHHKNWQRTGSEQGCITSLPISAGTRPRHEMDRESVEFKQLYDQRTAVERINSQAVALGIERPHLRNQQSITNQNTLTYVLINLRALQRVKEKKAQMQRNC